jgi:AcrR family transcriptional regulator
MRAAVALFSRKGFENTSVEEICLAAGYSKGGFYFHFRGKNDLLAQVLEQEGDVTSTGWLDAFTAELWAAAARNEALRRRLADRYNSPRRSLLETALARAEDPKSVTRSLMDLLLTLDAGLRVQQRFSVSSAAEARGFVDSLLTLMTEPGIELPAHRAREAS